jgi:type IV fimbrial biogenesis protein FimT
MHRKDAGFTLIEALVVLAVVSLLVTIALPAFQGSLLRTRAIGTMHLLSTDLAVARSAAIQRRQAVIACPRATDNRCSEVGDWSGGWVVFMDPDGNRQPDRPGEILRVSQASGTLRLPSSRRFVRYQADGRSAGTNLTIHVCSRHGLLGDVVVNNLGRVRTAKPTRETACPR